MAMEVKQPSTEDRRPGLSCNDIHHLFSLWMVNWTDLPGNQAGETMTLLKTWKEQLGGQIVDTKLDLGCGTALLALSLSHICV